LNFNEDVVFSPMIYLTEPNVLVFYI